MTRAEEAALRAYPHFTAENITEVTNARHIFAKGYEQAEKDTIKRAAEWIKTHWREYILGPDADGCICFGHWENDFRKAMGEEQWTKQQK